MRRWWLYFIQAIAWPPLRLPALTCVAEEMEPYVGDQILLSWIEQAVSALGLLATMEDSGAIKNHQALISLEFHPCGSRLISLYAHVNSRSLFYTETTIRFATQNGLQAQHLICKLEFRIGCSES